MRSLNDLSEHLYQSFSTYQPRNGRDLFITQLIDIITPDVNNNTNRFYPGTESPSMAAQSLDTFGSTDVIKKFKNHEIA